MSAIRRALFASMLATTAVSAAEPSHSSSPSHAVDASEDRLEEVAEDVRALLAEQGIAGVVTSRVKAPESLAEKMRRKGHSFERIRDRLGVRVVVEDERSCYLVRDHLAERYAPIDGSDRDYIRQPKANGYRSLHVAAHTFPEVVEFQVRTHEMHAWAEHGAASHALYKLATAA